MDDQQRARELLAAEYRKEGLYGQVDHSHGAAARAAIAAITAALRTAPEAVALRVAMDTLEQIANAPDDQGARLKASGAVAFLITQGVGGSASLPWQPIESAPEGRLVVVGWLDSEDLHYPENYDFDYLEDGLWAKHEDCVEHAQAVAPPGSKVPKEQPPYQWWMDLPAFPAARPQEATNA